MSVAKNTLHPMATNQQLGVPVEPTEKSTLKEAEKMLGRGRFVDVNGATELPKPYSDGLKMSFYANNQPGFRQQFHNGAGSGGVGGGGGVGYGHHQQHQNHMKHNGYPTSPTKAAHNRVVQPGQHHFEAEAERAYRGKKIILYRNGDVWDKGLVMSINAHEFANYAALITHLNRKQFLQRSPVNRIYTTGGQLIRELEDMRDGQAYVAATSGFTQVQYGKYTPPEWNISRQPKKVAHKSLFELDHKHPLDPPTTFRARPPPTDILKPVGIVAKGAQPSRISNGSFPFNSTGPNIRNDLNKSKPSSRVSDGSIGSLKNSPAYHPSPSDPSAIRRRAMSLTPPPPTHRGFNAPKTNSTTFQQNQHHNQGYPGQQQHHHGANNSRIPVASGQRSSHSVPERWDQVDIGGRNPPNTHRPPESHHQHQYDDDIYARHASNTISKPPAYTDESDRILTPTQYKKAMPAGHSGDYGRPLLPSSPSYSEPRHFSETANMSPQPTHHGIHMRTGSLTDLRQDDYGHNDYGAYDKPFEHKGYVEKNRPYSPMAGGGMQVKSNEYSRY